MAVLLVGAEEREALGDNAAVGGGVMVEADVGDVEAVCGDAVGVGEVDDPLDEVVGEAEAREGSEAVEVPAVPCALRREGEAVAALLLTDGSGEGVEAWSLLWASVASSTAAVVVVCGWPSAPSCRVTVSSSSDEVGLLASGEACGGSLGAEGAPVEPEDSGASLGVADGASSFSSLGESAVVVAASSWR